MEQKLIKYRIPIILIMVVALIAIGATILKNGEGLLGTASESDEIKEIYNQFQKIITEQLKVDSDEYNIYSTLGDLDVTSEKESNFLSACSRKYSAIPYGGDSTTLAQVYTYIVNTTLHKDFTIKQLCGDPLPPPTLSLNERYHDDRIHLINIINDVCESSYSDGNFNLYTPIKKLHRNILI